MATKDQPKQFSIIMVSPRHLRYVVNILQQNISSPNVNPIISQPSLFTSDNIA